MLNGLSSSIQYIKKNYFIGTCLILLSIRFFHLTSDIDGPHDWRQCDTANYIDDFYKNGIDLFHPTVCWMGSRDTVILEFPLPESIVAGVYKITKPSILIARLVFILFFLTAVFYLYRLLMLLFSKELSQLATLVYLALPLSIYYSRAIHIDFSVVALTHMMMYYFIKGIHQKKIKWIFISGIAFTLASLIKAPYVFCWLIPILYIVYNQKAMFWILKNSWPFLLGSLVFIYWQQYSNSINSLSPNLDYILGYRHMTVSLKWYFGTWQQRLSLYSWYVLLQRGVWEVTGIGGIVFFILGCLKSKTKEYNGYMISWLAGVIVFVLLFFNLNLVHNYYQIPLLAPASVLISIGIDYINRRYFINRILLFSIVLIANLLYTETKYYTVAHDEIEIAQKIKEYTGEQALVIVSYDKMDCRNPKILYRANRKGWSIEEIALKPTVIERLHHEQRADYWVYIGSTLPLEKMKGYLDNLHLIKQEPLVHNKANLYIFDLRE